MRKLIAAVCAAALTLLPGCGEGEPNSLFDAAGYHVRGDTVYYLRAFPGNASVIDGADAASFEVLDRTYAKDASRVYVDGAPLPDADPGTFALLERQGFAADVRHVWAHATVRSDDPGHFEFLAADLTKDRSHVYWADGSVLSDDPGGFEVVSDIDHYVFTKDAEAVHVNGAAIVGAEPATFRVLDGAYSRDARGAFYFTDPMPDADLESLDVLEGPYARDSRHAYWRGKTIPGADPASFTVLNGDFECTADATRAFYRDTAIDGAVPAAFPSGKAVTNCSESFIGFAE